jgi:succinate dehydrogenase/fumarate reductase iron-sulfur protein
VTAEPASTSRAGTGRTGTRPGSARPAGMGQADPECTGANGPGMVGVVVRRSGPARLQAYTVARIAPMKVLDALLAIQRDLDPTLAFRFSCRVAMCGTCTVRVNGRAVLACQAEIPDGDRPVHVEPLTGLPVLRDLVTDTAPFFAQWAAITPYFVPRTSAAGPARIAPGSPERAVIDPRLDCITCGACWSSCGVAAAGRGFLGPAALNRALVLVADSRDGATSRRLARVAAADGTGRCHYIFGCTADCPKGLDPAGAIRALRRGRFRPFRRRWWAFPGRRRLRFRPGLRHHRPVIMNGDR